MTLHTPDPYRDVQDATRLHLRHHGCGAYTYADGSLPGVIAAAAGARRIVEVGTALGYTALWLAHASTETHVDTIEADADHVRLARQQIHAHGRIDSITVHHGNADDILEDLDIGGYDMAFFDGFAPTASTFTAMSRRLRVGGVFVAANLTLGAEPSVLDDLDNPNSWLTHSFGETAIGVKASARTR